MTTRSRGRSQRTPRSSRRQRRALLESLEQRLLMVSQWQNPCNPLDVNNDQIVTPFDVLAPINRLNAVGGGTLPTLPDADSPPPYFDVSGDGDLVPTDVLLVINALNRVGQDEIFNFEGQLVRDTAPGGATNDDLITFDGRLEGVITSLLGLKSFQAQIDGGEIIEVPQTCGAFMLDPGFSTDGTDDGLHVVSFTGTDPPGRQATFDVTFTLDTLAPSIDLRLAANSDTAPAGDDATALGEVSLTGGTEANLPVTLFAASDLNTPVLETSSDTTGTYQFDGLDINLGANEFTAMTSDLAGNENLAPRTIRRHIPLREETNFNVVFEKPVVVPSDPSTLTVTYSELNFDQTDEFVNDAFELALLDSDGSAVFSIAPGNPQREAFFNATEGERPVTARGVVHDGNLVSVDISQLFPGQELTLVARLVNNDQDTQTQVLINDVTLRSGPPFISSVASATTPPNFAALDSAGGVELVQLGSDLTVNSRTASSAPSPTPGDELVVQASAPGDAFSVGSSILLEGHVAAAPSRITHVTVNGLPVDSLDSAGGFFSRVAIQPGHNRFQVVAVDAEGRSGTTQVTVIGESTTPELRFDLLSDVTSTLTPEFKTTTLDDQGGTLHVELAVQNHGNFAVDGPILIGVTNISDPSAALIGFDGLTPGGVPYLDITGQLPNRLLGPGESSDPLTLDFRVTAKERFDFDVVFLGQLNRAPFFTSAPTVEIPSSAFYVYQARATDPDRDAVSFELLLAPAGMTVDSATGVIEWQPSLADQGVHSVIVQAADGRGGKAAQRYELDVIEPPANRPPIFTTAPVIDAVLGRTYTYDADAIDLDQDDLAYSVVDGPRGLSIDRSTGEVSWDPTADQILQQSRGDARGEVVTLFDGTFADSDWTAELADTPPTNPTFETRQVATGGSPGSYRRTSHTYRGPDLGILVAHLSNQLRYDPSQQGAIDTIDYDLDLILFDGGASRTVAYTMLLRQDGQLYSASTAGFFLTPIGDATNVWVDRGGAGISAEDFRRTGGGDGHPDFSANGGPIEFGFLSGNGTQFAAETTTLSGIDNLEITINPVQLPEVPGFAVSLYAEVPENPDGMAFSPGGDAFVGGDATGMGGNEIDEVQIQRIGAGGSPIEGYGVQPIGDPDTVFFDTSGTFSGVPGALLVGGTVSGLVGHIVAILPDESIEVVFGPSTTVGNVSDMTRDNRGRLLFVNCNNNTVLVSEGDEPTVLFTSPAVIVDLAIHPRTNDIYTSDIDGTIRIYDESGQLLDNNFSAGLGRFPDMVFGEGRLGDDLFVLSRTRGELVRVDENGDQAVLGTNFRHGSLYLGPGETLYVTEFDHGRIIQIKPDKGLLGLASNEHPVTLSVEDGRGGFAHQKYVVRVVPDPDNSPPVITSTPTLSVKVGERYEYDVEAIDAEEDTLHFTLENDTTAPQATINSDTGFVTFELPYSKYAEALLEQEAGPPVEINFDDGQVDTPVADFYSSLGVRFDNAAFSDRFDGRIGTSRPLSVRSESSAGFPKADDPIELFFDRPLAEVSLRGIDVGANGIRVEAYNVLGELLGSDEQIGRGLGNDGAADNAPLLNVSAPGIRSLLVYQPFDMPSDGMAFDNLSFVPLQQPEFDLAVQVTDGRGGFDGQIFSVEVVDPAGGSIRGTKYHDLDEDGQRGIVPPVTGSLSPADERGILLLTHDGTSGRVGPVLERAGFEIVVGSLEAPGKIAETLSERDDINQVWVWRDAATPQSTGPAFTEEDLSALAEFNATHPHFVFDALAYRGHPIRGPLTPDEENLTVNEATNLFNAGGGIILGTDDASRELLVRQVNEVAELFNFNPLFGVYETPAHLLQVGGTLFTSPNNVDPTQLSTASGTYAELPHGPQPNGLYLSTVVYGSPSEPWSGWADPVPLPSGTINGEEFEKLNHIITTTIPGAGVDPIPEPGVTGFVIYIDANNNGVRDIGERFTTTDTGGEYVFGELPPGEYIIREESPAGWRSVSPVSGHHTVTVVTGEVVGGVDFGNVEDEENSAPQFTSTPPTEVRTQGLLSYVAQAEDANREPLKFDLSLGPQGLAISPTGLVRWRPLADQVGSHTVILRVRDTQGGFDLQSFEITVSHNTAPAITSLPKLTAQQGALYSYQLTAQDAEGGELTFELLDGPSGLTVDSVTGELTWVPTEADLSEHSVRVQVSDPEGAVDLQAYTLTARPAAENRSPMIRSTPRFDIGLGQTYAYQIVAEDTDGDPLTYSLEVAPDGMVVNAGGLITWPVSATASGLNDVAVRVEDGRGGAATQRFDILVTGETENEPPQITSVPTFAGVVQEPYRYDPIAEDPDGDVLTWSLLDAPTGVSLDPASGVLRWTPDNSHLGFHQIAVQVTDALGASAIQGFGVTIVTGNSPPVVTSAPPSEAIADELYSYAPRALDPDGDMLRYALQQAPASMQVDDQTGVVSWAPTVADLGSHEIELLIDDGRGGVGVQAFTVTVSTSANQPPVISSTPAFVATVGEAYSYSILAADPEGAPLRYKLIESPAGMTIDAGTGVVTWLPQLDQTGSRGVKLAAFDDLDLAAAQQFTVTVREQNAPPVLNNVPPNIAVIDQLYAVPLDATDADGDSILFELLDGPAGLTLDEFGRLEFTPSEAQLGTHRIEMQISDERGAGFTAGYDLEVVADTEAPQVIVEVSPNPVRVGQQVTFTVRAVDNIGIAETQLTVGGDRVVLDANQRAVVRFEQPAVLEIEATASDSAGNSATTQQQVQVIDTTDLTAPRVEIHSPSGGSEVRSLVDVVGTISDDNLVSYSLAVVSRSTGVEKEIARGSSTADNEVIGTVDATMLSNDSYALRLTALDAGGHTSVVERDIEVVGGLKLGNYTLSFLDLSVPLSGIPIQVTRIYDSLEAGRSDEFGFGWRLNVSGTRLTDNVGRTGSEDFGLYRPFFDGARVYLTLPDGSRETFLFLPEGRALLTDAIYRPKFVALGNSGSTLSVDRADLRRASDGTYRSFIGGLPYNPADPAFGGNFTLTTLDGVRYTIDGSTGNLNRVTDRNGNSLQYTPGGIFSSTGRSVRFDRDASGRIVQIIDPMDNVIRYEYDANGDLVASTDRESNRTQYRYHSEHSHFLEEVIDPLGRIGTRTEYLPNGRLARVIGSDGSERSFTFDPANMVTTVFDSFGNPLTREFDERGNIVTTIDAHGNTTRRSFDNNDFVVSTTDALGDTASFTRDQFGRRLSHTDGLGNTRHYQYGDFGTVLNSVDALGNTTTFNYDAAGNQLSETDALGNVTRFEYDSAGNQTSVIDPDGNGTLFEYDTFGNQTKVIDALGNETHFEYDAGGNLLRETFSVTTPEGVRPFEILYAYDANGNVTATTDAEGNTNRVEYDELGNRSALVDANDSKTELGYVRGADIAEVRFPDGQTNRFQYDSDGRQTSRTDRMGRSFVYVYDDLGLPTELVFPDLSPDSLDDNPRVELKFDGVGRVTSSSDLLGNDYESTFDAAGRVIVRRDPLGNGETFKYDAEGRTIERTDAKGHTTRMVYDPLGQLIQTVFPDGATQTAGYDARGNRVSETNAAGHTTRFEYDELNRLVAVISSLEGRREYGYDESGNLIREMDAEGRVTRYEYNGNGQRTAIIRPLGQRSEVTYNPVGLVETMTDFNGEVVSFTYNELGLLVERKLGNELVETFGYNESGERQLARDSRGDTTYLYDGLENLVSRSEPDGTKVEYSYNRANFIESVTSSGGITHYTYDELNRVSTATDSDGGITSYTYDANGNITRTAFPNATVETREYDSMNRATRVRTLDVSNGVVSDFSYTYDELSNIRSVQDHSGRQTSFSYDPLNRLVSESIVDPVLGDRSIAYTYDLVGNRRSRDDSANGMTVYTYDDNDRLTSEATDSSVTTYTYDDNGNLTSTFTSDDNQVVYEWDVFNRLAKATVTTPSGVQQVEYGYDVDGNRVSRSIDGVETRFVLDTNRALTQVLAEVDADSRVLASYVYGPRLISQKRGDVRSYYLFDAQNDTRGLSDADGVVTDRYTFDGFGQTLVTTGDTTNEFLFNGEQFDASIDQYYLRARYYAPNQGRFTSVDPFEGQVEIPTSRHDYTFASNSPIAFADPTGRFTLAESLTVAAGIARITTIAAVTYAGLNHGLGFARGFSPIQWNGVFSNIVVSVQMLGISPGLLFTSTKECHPVDGEPTPMRVVADSYFTLLAGLSVGVPLPFSFSLGLFDFATPGDAGITGGLVGAGPFAGPALLGSVAGPGFGLAALFVSGQGVGFSAPGIALNVGAGLDFLGGITIPLPDVGDSNLVPCERTPHRSS